MSMKPVKVNAKNQVTIPKSISEKLKIKAGDHLLVNVQDGVIILIPKLGRYTESLKGLHSEIWQAIDVKKYLDRERRAWGKI